MFSFFDKYSEENGFQKSGLMTDAKFYKIILFHISVLQKEDSS